jgi:hypothetical protein
MLMFVQKKKNGWFRESELSSKIRCQTLSLPLTDSETSDYRSSLMTNFADHIIFSQFISRRSVLVYLYAMQSTLLDSSRRKKASPSSQENFHNSAKQYTDLPWRKDEQQSASANKPVRSHGIVSAKACYGKSGELEGHHVVHRLKADIRDRSIQMKKKRIGSECEAKLQAFKQVTTYKTWPIQERALQHLRELRREYLHEQNNQNEENDNPTGEALPLNAASIPPESSSCSSSSSSSTAASFDEPKRMHIDPLLSPAKSRLKSKFQRDFINEQKLPKQQPYSESVFAPPLWSMEPRLFSYERNSSGKRSYVVAQLGRFFDKYWRRTDPKARHYYEVIPEHTPCRLYLDLEFSKTNNLNMELHDDEVAEGLMTELFCELQSEFKTVFDIALLREHIVDLDSSTSTKFSRHWVVHLPGDYLFPDNIALGRFVKGFVSRLSEEQATGQLETKGRLRLHRHLFVETSHKGGLESTTCVIDLGVYTRNRLFRLLGSQKFGKPPFAALRLAKANQFPFPENFDNTSFFLPAMQEVTNVPSHVSQDESFDFGDALDQAVEKFVALTDWSTHAEALALTLVVPMNSSKMLNLILPCEDILPDFNNKTDTGNSTTSFRPRATTPALSMGASPFSCLDKFVTESLATRGGIQGSIRAWSIDQNDKGLSQVITYQMVRNRYCECVGRAHKSNNIMWTVDLRSLTCWQGCHDPDCRRRNFRGSVVELPENVREEVREFLFEEELASLNEVDLLNDGGSTAFDEQPSNDKDELEFERALACLNLDGLSTSMNDELAISVLPSCSTTDTLSDDALLHAMTSAPELFP